MSEEETKVNPNTMPVKLFTKFMKKFGINLVQYFAYAISGGKETTVFPNIEELEGPIVGSSFATEFYSTCWYGVISLNI